jgi:NADH-quinone oxidoreductase subunit N
MLKDLFYIAPLLSVGIGAIVLMLLSPIKSLCLKKAGFLAVGFIAVGMIFNFYNFGKLYTYYPFEKSFNSMLIADTYSGYFSAILMMGAFLTLLIGMNYFEKNREFSKEFFSLFLFSLFGMMLLVHANELITAFIALEIASLSMYVMIGYQKAIERRVEASYRYLVLGSLAGAFFLFGSALVYAATNTTKLSQIGLFVTQNIENDITILIVGATMLFITFLFKIAAFPFQNCMMEHLIL